mmetsp:Transcript_49368/g.149783  ORF Transcript_49368/g.149783 Transcript_49368/m.149783 type:complete len:226 (+) Transcript_49368:2045-2722(+)
MAGLGRAAERRPGLPRGSLHPLPAPATARRTAGPREPAPQPPGLATLGPLLAQAFAAFRPRGHKLAFSLAALWQFARWHGGSLAFRRCLPTALGCSQNTLVAHGRFCTAQGGTCAGAYFVAQGSRLAWPCSHSPDAFTVLGQLLLARQPLALARSKPRAPWLGGCRRARGLSPAASSARSTRLARQNGPRSLLANNRLLVGSGPSGSLRSAGDQCRLAASKVPAR